MRKCNIPFKDYNDRLTKLNIKSLQQRRLIFDLILIYRIINGLSDINFNDHFSFKSHSYNLRQNSLQIQSNFKLIKNQKFNNCFFIRIIKYWNVLPNDIVISPSLEVFKKRILSFDFSAMIQSKGFFSWALPFSTFTFVFSAFLPDTFVALIANCQQCCVFVLSPYHHVIVVVSCE